MNKKLAWLSKLGLVKWSLLIASGVAILFALGIFEPLELLTLDGRFRLRGDRAASSDLAIVGITQECVQKIGKLPWSRSVYAQVINRLTEAGAKIICFDIFFVVPSEQQGDLKLVEATQSAGNVIYPVFSPLSLKSHKKGPVYRVKFLRENIEPISRVAAGVGHINVPPDRDGKTRGIPVALEFKEKLVYQLGLETVIHYWGIDKRSITLKRNSLQLGERNMPLTREGELLINYYGQEKSMDFYPFHRVLEGNLPGKNFEDKIVLIGQTAHGLPNADLVSTPQGKKYGLIIQSIVIDNLLKGDFLVRQGLISSLVAIIFISLLTGVLFARASLWKSIIYFLTLLVLVIIGAIYLFQKQGFILEVTPYLITLVANFGLSLTLNLQKSRQEIMQKDFQLGSMVRTSQISEEDLDMDKVPQIMVNAIGETVGVEALNLYFCDEVAKNLSLKAEYCLNRKLAKSEVSQIATIANCLVQERGKPFLTKELSQDSRFKKVSSNVSSFLSIPLVVREQIRGILNFYNKRPSSVSSSHYFTKEDLRLISVLSHQTAVILENGCLVQDLGAKNEQLRQALQDLKAVQKELVKREKLSAVGRMASMIIHDLKNPIGAVRGYAELLGQVQESEQRTKYSQIILTQIDRVTEMVQEVLDYTKGKSGLRPQIVTAETLMGELVTLLKEDFQKQGIKLVADISFKGPMKIDKEKVMRVFLNLARNASEAMPGEGRVEITSRKKDGFIEFRVSDDGPGIPEDIKKNLFEPFVTHGKEHGTGLGLAIVKKIVEEHGGRISVETELGEGTTFIVELPKEMKKNESKTRY